MSWKLCQMERSRENITRPVLKHSRAKQTRLRRPRDGLNNKAGGLVVAEEFAVSDIE